MDRHERQIACQLLRDHFGPISVGECAEPPYIVVWANGSPIAQVGDEADWSDGKAIAQGIIEDTTDGI